MILRQFHYERCRLSGKRTCFFEHNSGNNNGENSNKICRYRNQTRTSEQRPRKQTNDRHLSAARNKASGHNGHTAVTFIFNGTRCHNSASGADEHWNKGLSRKTKFSENPIHNKGNTRHITDILKYGQHQKQHKHLRYKSKHSAAAANNTFYHKTNEPWSTANRDHPSFYSRRDDFAEQYIIGPSGHPVADCANCNIVH